MMRLADISKLFVLLILLSSCSVPYHEYPKIEPGRELTFPRDHYAHPEFRTEWWYYSGHLDAEDGTRYGFELVFFVRRTDMDKIIGIPVSNVFPILHTCPTSRLPTCRKTGCFMMRKEPRIT